VDAKQIWVLAEECFMKRSSLLLLWQEMAENFYPERADFTWTRSLGDDFASNLMTSYPILCRRDLGDQLGSMLRPTAKEWFHVGPRDEMREDNDSRRWLEWATGLQRRAMYDRASRFTRATKEGDHDFATFGQCALSVEVNHRKSSLLYRSYHLRDVTWLENEDGDVGVVFRKWKPQARELLRLYPNTAHQNLRGLVARDPFAEVECMHMVVEADMYTGDTVGPGPQRGGAQPRFLICYDQTHDTVLEATPIWHRHYVVPRWQTVSGSQFAYSPATVAALADGRLIQAMTLTLLEAGEKITNPPMIATMEAVRSDINIYPGGVTWVDIEYDEKMGEALRSLNTDAKGMPIGIDMQRDARQMIMQAFFLNKLSLPIRSPEMTAYEVGQRIQQYIRDALPIFEPMEMEYNGALCEETFDLLLRNGAFGNVRDIPRALQGADLQFRFESPLHDAIEQQKGQKFPEMKGMLAEAIAVDPNTAMLPDVVTALRDALKGIGVPAMWVHGEAAYQEAAQRSADAKQAEATLGRLVEGAGATADLASAQKDLAVAQTTV
jgi:hypothetical protein